MCVISITLTGIYFRTIRNQVDAWVYLD